MRCLPSPGWCSIWLARLVLRAPSRADLRLEQIRPESTVEAARRKPVFGGWTQALAAQIPESEKERRDFEMLLRQAGMYAPDTADTLYAWRFVLFLAPLLVAGMLRDSCRWPLRIRLLWRRVSSRRLYWRVLPRLYVYFRRRRRMQRIREGLPDALDMLSMCVSGGLELGESLEQVARRLIAYPECADELLLLKRQSELGSLKRAPG